jgi:hypothetical protein
MRLWWEPRRCRIRGSDYIDGGHSQALGAVQTTAHLRSDRLQVLVFVGNIAS